MQLFTHIYQLKLIPPTGYKYIIGILGILFVLFFAYWFSGETKLVEIVSFAGTITSIILSVLAIFMTVLSNDSMSSMIHKIRDVHDSIKDMPSSINESIAQLKLSSIKMEKMLPELKDKLKEVDEHLLESNQNLAALKNSKIETPVGSSDNEGQKLSAKDFLLSFLKNSSLSGLGVVYCLFLASRDNKSFKLSDYAEAFQYPNIDYAYAYCIACFANRLAVGNVDIQNDSLVTNVKFSHLIKENDIYEAIKNWLSNMIVDKNKMSAEEFMSTIMKLFD